MSQVFNSYSSSDELHNDSQDSDYQEATHKIINIDTRFRNKREKKLLGKRGNIEIESRVLNEESQQIIKNITKNYDLTYKNIRRYAVLKRQPLSNYEPEEIKDFIKSMRLKLGKKPTQIKNIKVTQDNFFEYLSTLYQDQLDQQSLRINEQQQQQIKNLNNLSPDLQGAVAQISKYILENFNSFENKIKVTIQMAFIQQLISDQEIFNYCQDLQLTSQQDKIFDYFKKRDINNIQENFKGMSMEQIINIHLNSNKQIKELQLEGQTLFMTLYPYLQGNNIINHVQENSFETFKTMILTINRHISDNKLEYSPSFLGLMIDINSNLAQKIFISNKNTKQFQEYLTNQGFDQTTSKTISENPRKFIWQGFLDKIFDINNLYKNDMIDLISKCQIITDPNSILQEYIKLFSQRRMILTLICKKKDIQLPFERLLLILQQLKDMDIDDIEEIFEFEENMWLKEITKKQSLSMTSSMNNQNIEIFKKIYSDQLKQFQVKNLVSIDQMMEISNKIENVCDEYKHSDYQAIVAATILSIPHSIIQAHLPTASGKTWIIGLISEFWRQKGKKVTVIVPNQILKTQTERLLIPLGINIQIETIQTYYEQKHNHEILIVDEYERIAIELPFYAYQNKIYGLWDLSLTQCYLFSATCDLGIQSILQRLLGQPAVIQFKSEIEILSGIQQDQGGEIILLQSEDERIQTVKQQIEKLMNHTPLIIFCEKDQIDKYDSVIQTFNINNFKKEITIQILDEIQQWNSGILLLNQSESYGYNTKFKQDAKVLIACNVESESEYLQMRGRSSRSRGNLQSIYYVVTNLSKAQVLLQMKKLSLNKFRELEYLLEVIYKKRNQKNLIEAINESQQVNDQIRSLNQLKQMMGTSYYEKMIKTFK